MNKNILTIETSREIDDDVWFYVATARRNGLTGFAHGYSETGATQKAIEHLIKQEKNLTPNSPNWENSVESFLCR